MHFIMVPFASFLLASMFHALNQLSKVLYSESHNSNTGLQQFYYHVIFIA
jgi:hypothetical protein